MQRTKKIKVLSQKQLKDFYDHFDSVLKRLAIVYKLNPNIVKDKAKTVTKASSKNRAR